jgi:hypothetical protein
MPSLEYDLVYLQNGLIDLEGYLLSNELYWPVGANSPPGEPPYPRVTLGNLLLSKKRLQAQSLDGENNVEFERIKERLDGTKSEWRVAWGRKAAREFSARLTLWRDFIEEYRKKPEANIDRYAYEVSRRVLLELLKAEAENVSDEEKELLAGLDEVLSALLVPGDFVWEEQLQGAFPKGQFWYLYGTPKLKENEF